MSKKFYSLGLMSGTSMDGIDISYVSTDGIKKIKIYNEKSYHFSLKEIEKLNILNASLLAMKRSIKKLKSKPSLIMIDGNRLPIMSGYKLKSIIKGDQKVPEISAASIIAKVSRDRFISKMSENFKKYAWNKNSGYGTKQHLSAIKKFGVTKHHRKTFSPIHNILSLKNTS